ncbi:Hsp20/alpha crystallin family protein [Flavobacterium aquiphilum]|uniref:Hsp20/alpha crystallin family protein n=1 Tax=Flavobacterium aquiphilum TaxID=3003261 RepID=UPI00248175FA|nr:Hsp20/alpha crystallin family protein [Flavobacterium aquiphilum]
MGTLIKRDGSFPSVVSKLVNPLFEDFFTRDITDWADRNISAIGVNLPSVNLKETDLKLEIELAAPGLKKEDFKIEVDHRTLIISAEKEEKKESNKKDDYVRKEFNYQSFYRSFSLPDNADENKIEASYKDGILNVTIDKKNNGKKKELKSITVK